MSTQRVIVKGTLANIVQTRNMFTASITESGGDTSEVLWSAYISNFYDSFTSILATVYQTYSYEIQEYILGSWAPVEEVTYVYTGGNDTSDYLPNAVSIVLLGKATGLRHVGRKFISGLAETGTTGNILSGAAVAQAAAALLAYISPFTGIGGGLLQPGVISGDGTFHPFVGGVVSSILGSMRRRKPGNGM
ncbi:MAG: hypothetical protein [Circular genetic element sp.]|nr:MAG: hypothetical protein [Circular genetic element sp.]